MSAIYYYSIADFSSFFKSYLQRNQIFSGMTEDAATKGRIWMASVQETVFRAILLDASEYEMFVDREPKLCYTFLKK